MKRTAACLIMLITLAYSGWSAGGAETEGTEKPESILKIGTPNVVKSSNIFSDYYLGIFAHISNPPLMKMTSEGKLEGLTAERYEVSKDNTVWTFYIKDDQYWCDGKKLSPEDVRFSIEYTAKHNPNAGWIKDTLIEATILENNAVVLTFNKPYTRLNLEFATYNIYPKHVWEQIADPMKQSNPGMNIGFGPFYIEKINLDAGLIRFKKNPFWKGKQPEIDGYEIHIYKSMDVLSLALEKSEVHTYFKYASSYPYSNIERLKKTQSFDFVEKLNIGLVFLGINLKKKPCSDPAFREAVSFCIDYNEIVKLDALGYGIIPNRGFVPESMGNYKATKKLEYNASKARELLSGAGYRDSDGNGIIEDSSGKDIKLTILVRSNWARVAELLKSYLADIGIEVVTRSADLNTWVAEKDKYNYDLTITRTTPWGMLMHASYGTGYFDSRRTGRGVLHILDDPYFLKLSDDILSTTDLEELNNLSSRVQDYYAEKLPAIALYWNTIVTPFNRDFTGWKPDPLYGIYNVDNFLSVKKN